MIIYKIQGTCLITFYGTNKHTPFYMHGRGLDSARVCTRLGEHRGQMSQRTLGGDHGHPQGQAAVEKQG